MARPGRKLWAVAFSGLSVMRSVHAGFERSEPLHDRLEPNAEIANQAVVFGENLGDVPRPFPIHSPVDLVQQTVFHRSLPVVFEPFTTLLVS
jgi:hypothetical protein